MTINLKKEKNTIDILWTVEKDIRRRIRHGILQYEEANNKYMKNYNKDKDQSNLMYCNVNTVWMGNVANFIADKIKLTVLSG